MRYASLLGALLLVLAATAPATAARAPAAPAADAAAQESDCTFPVELTDQSGTTVTVEESPSRVVTLNPSAAQTMWELGAQDRVVGVTKFAMNLEGAEEKTNISSGGETINNEVVVGLEPDLVLAPNTVDNETVRSLRDAGLTVYHFDEAKSIAGIQEKTRIIGALTGECAAAEDTVDWMDAELATVDAAVEGQDRPGMIYTFFGWTAGNGTFIGTLVERAGASNVAAEAGIEGYEELNEDVLVDQDPDWILLNSDDDQVPKTAAYNGTTAVQKDQILVVNYNQLNRPAPRVIYPLVAMTKAMHPEAYAQANQTESDTATGTETASPTATTAPPTGSPDTETEDGSGTGASGPGFTAIGALVALVCLSLVAARREA
jgi:iron complex transport system substrate-binding protein